MKITLEFDLPDEQHEFDSALKGASYRSVLWDLDQYLRGEIKHGEHPEGVLDTFEKVRDRLHEFLNDEEIVI